MDWLGFALTVSFAVNHILPCFSDASLFSRDFDLFTLTPGKQQINVTVLAISEARATSEAMSASSDRAHVRHAARTLAAMRTEEYIT